MSETKEPTVSEEIEALRNEAYAEDSNVPVPSSAAETETPAGSEEAEDESVKGLTDNDSPEPEVAEESAPEGEEAEAPEAEAEEAPVSEEQKELGEATEVDSEEPSPTRSEKKKGALKRTWDNAERRHRDADEREQLLAQRESELLQRQQQQTEAEAPADPLPKYTLEEIGNSVEEFISDGDFDTAKELVRGMVSKANALSQAKAFGPDHPEFRQAWEHFRGEAMRSNPELKDPKTPLYKEATGLLNGDWRQLFESHPAGVSAAVEVAKLRLLAASVSGLKEEVKRVTTENQKLRNTTALDETTPTVREMKGKDFEDLSLEEQLDSLRAEAAALS